MHWSRLFFEAILIFSGGACIVPFIMMMGHAIGLLPPPFKVSLFMDDEEC